MSIFFNQHYLTCKEAEVSGPFSFDPSILSLKELLMHEIKQISYYIKKLDDLDTDTAALKDKVINFIALVIMNLDFKREEFNYIVQDLKENRVQLEKKYIELCFQKGINSQTLNPIDSLNDGQIDIISAIKKGEEHALLKNLVLSKTKKNLYEIMISLVQNACQFLVEINIYGQTHVEGKNAVINLLNISNFPTIPDEKWFSKTLEFSAINFDIMEKLKDIVLEKYGPIQEKEVDLHFKGGDSILVSGHCYKDLEDILKATENSDIKIYTHSDMLIAHSLSEFNKYPNLTGHYQKTLNNTKVDFAAFPGAILITKNSQHQIDMTRGRIFTFDKYPAFGMSKINENNLNPLMEAAKDTWELSNETNSRKIKVGYNEKSILVKVDDIISKIKSGEIKHLFMIDLFNQQNQESQYVYEFFNTIPDDYYVISLSYKSNKENVWHIDSFFSYALSYDIIERIMKSCDSSKLRFTMFITQCNIHTIPHVFNLKSLGVKSIYIGNCCPSIINPYLIKGLDELFEIKYMSDDAQKDLNDIVQKFNYE